MKERFLKPGPWERIKTAMAKSVGIKFMYPLAPVGRSILSLDVGEHAMNEADSPSRPALLVSANFHRDFPEGDVSALNAHLEYLAGDWATFDSAINAALGEG